MGKKIVIKCEQSFNECFIKDQYYMANENADGTIEVFKNSQGLGQLVKDNEEDQFFKDHFTVINVNGLR